MHKAMFCYDYEGDHVVFLFDAAVDPTRDVVGSSGREVNCQASVWLALTCPLTLTRHNPLEWGGGPAPYAVERGNACQNGVGTLK